MREGNSIASELFTGGVVWIGCGFREPQGGTRSPHMEVQGVNANEGVLGAS
jgi:hypothetical protein